MAAFRAAISLLKDACPEEAHKTFYDAYEATGVVVGSDGTSVIGSAGDILAYKLV